MRTVRGFGQHAVSLLEQALAQRAHRDERRSGLGFDFSRMSDAEFWRQADAKCREMSSRVAEIEDPEERREMRAELKEWRAVIKAQLKLVAASERRAKEREIELERQRIRHEQHGRPLHLQENNPPAAGHSPADRAAGGDLASEKGSDSGLAEQQGPPELKLIKSEKQTLKWRTGGKQK